MNKKTNYKATLCSKTLTKKSIPIFPSEKMGKKSIIHVFIKSQLINFNPSKIKWSSFLPLFLLRVMQSFAIISGFIKWVIQKICETSVLPTRFPKLKVVKLQNNSIPSPRNNCPLPPDSPCNFPFVLCFRYSPFPHKKNHPPPPPPAPTEPTAPSPQRLLFCLLTPPPPSFVPSFAPKKINNHPPPPPETINHHPPSPKEKFLTNLRESCKQKK